MRALTDSQIRAFRRKIFRFYTLHGRDLPWRRTTDPYKITISEIMLHQTQVERVVPKYLEWIARWPTWQSLSRATTRELLAAWSGLGYNRRALFLGKLAQAVAEDFGGALPDKPESLQRLPGIGPYTSKAILIFAFNRPMATIDTNIRRVLIHELDLSPTITARELEKIALAVLPRRRARDWHNALMDYSRIILPKQLKHIPPVSRQSKFEGSLRQIRGEIIRQLISKKSVSVEVIARASGRRCDDVTRAVQALVREGIIAATGGRIRLVEG